MKTSTCALASLLAIGGLVAFGCKDPTATTTDAGAKLPVGSASSSAASATSAVPRPPTDSPGSDEILPVYPRDAGATQPLAVRFCEALYLVPAKRGTECCGGAAPVASGLMNECARLLSYAIESHAVTLEAPAVDACVQAMTQATTGCDWVTPSPSVPTPAACEGLIHGQLAEKATCRSSLECKAGERCVGLSAVDLGTCGPPQPVGSACNVANDTLAVFARQDHYAADHAECDGYCGGRKCQPASVEGSDCRSDIACGKLRCEAGKCTKAPLPAAGEACTAECASGLRCKGGHCAAPKGEGDACTDNTDCRGRCVMGDAGAGGLCSKMCEQAFSFPPLKPGSSPRPRRRPPGR